MKNVGLILIGEAAAQENLKQNATMSCLKKEKIIHVRQNNKQGSFGTKINNVMVEDKISIIFYLIKYSKFDTLCKKEAV